MPQQRIVVVRDANDQVVWIPIEEFKGCILRQMSGGDAMQQVTQAVFGRAEAEPEQEQDPPWGLFVGCGSSYIAVPHEVTREVGESCAEAILTEAWFTDLRRVDVNKIVDRVIEKRGEGDDGRPEEGTD